MPVQADTPQLSKEMLVRDIVALCPGAADIMTEYGMHCFSCSLGGLETLEEAGRIHGFEEELVDSLLVDLNEAFLAQPERPQEIIVTLEAARGLKKIAESEGRNSQGLAVVLDEQGGFCMEFREEPEVGDKIFTHTQEPEVRVFASTLTLKRIGGATIDMVEGRFKLDLADVAEQCGCGGSCSCS